MATVARSGTAPSKKSNGTNRPSPERSSVIAVGIRETFSVAVAGTTAGVTGWSSASRLRPLKGPPLAPEPLPEDPDVFWANPLPALADVDLGAATVPDMHAALPQQLGRFAFWQGEQELIPALRDIYRNASQSALDNATPASPALRD